MTKTITLDVEVWEIILKAAASHLDRGVYGSSWQSADLTCAAALLGAHLAAEPENYEEEK